jgi:hypothetical protein
MTQPGPLEGLIKLLTATLRLAPREKKLDVAFTIKPADFPPCHTRTLREGRGFPWQRQMLCHRNHRGELEISPVKPTALDSQRPTDRKRLR